MSPTPRAREAYSPPRLTVFGAVADLTASGAQGSCETGLIRSTAGNCIVDSQGGGNTNNINEPSRRK